MPAVWTAPKTWLPVLVKEDELNEQLRDNLLYLYDAVTAVAAVPRVHVIDRDVVAATIASSTTPTAVYSFSVPADTLASDRKLRLTLIGAVTNNTGGNQNVTTTAAFGGSTILNSGAVSLGTSANGRYWRVVIEIAAKNATNAQVTDADIAIGAAGTFNGTNTGSPQFQARQGNTIAIDTTSAQTLSVTVTLGTSSSDLSLTAHAAHLELLGS